MNITWKKGLAAAAAVGSLACGAVAAIPAAPAHASPNTYISRPCATKAVTGTGRQGHGCDRYGDPVWAEAGKDPLPRDMGGWLKQCAAGGTTALILQVVEPKPFAPVLFLGCVAGMAEALIKDI